MNLLGVSYFLQCIFGMSCCTERTILLFQKIFRTLACLTEDFLFVTMENRISL